MLRVVGVLDVLALQHMRVAGFQQQSYMFGRLPSCGVGLCAHCMVMVRLRFTEAMHRTVSPKFGAHPYTASVSTLLACFMLEVGVQTQSSCPGPCRQVYRMSFSMFALRRWLQAVPAACSCNGVLHYYSHAIVCIKVPVVLHVCGSGTVTRLAVRTSIYPAPTCAAKARQATCLALFPSTVASRAASMCSIFEVLYGNTFWYVARFQGLAGSRAQELCLYWKFGDTATLCQPNML